MEVAFIEILVRFGRAIRTRLSILINMQNGLPPGKMINDIYRENPRKIPVFEKTRETRKQRSPG
jgi:hypothetical protein